MDLRQFHSRMEPWSVGAKQHLCRSGALDSLFQDVESTNARGVRVNVWMPNEVIDQRDLRLPVISEAAKVRNDEIDVGIFFGEQFAHRNSAHHVVEHWQ